MYKWIIVLYTWNEHTVNQQYLKFFKKVNSSTGDS